MNLAPVPRVLYDFDVFNRQRYGGIGRYFIELIRHMPPDLANVRFFAGLHISRMLHDAFPGSGIRLPSLPKTATVREFINQGWLNIECKKWRPNVFHKTLYCRQEPPSGSKLVITLHDLASARFPHLFGGSDRETPLKRYWAGRADAILAVSETTRRDAIEILGIPPQRITVTRLGVNPQEPTALQRAVSPHGRPYMLYVGTRYEYKNFRNLLRAYVQSARTRSAFDLICYGGGGFSQEEKSIIRNSGTESRIHLRSGDDSKLLHYYLHSRALIMPSIYEGFGLPLLEAMSAGCPLLCSDIPTSREVAGDAAAYFPSTDVEAISTSLETVLFDEDLLAQKVAVGRERVNGFSWVKCASETAAVYRSI